MPGGAWRWRVGLVASLLARSHGETLFFAGCAEEQREFAWDLTVLLTAPEWLIVARLRERTTNPFGQTTADRRKVRRDLREFEPLMRRVADVVVDATQPLPRVVDAVLAAAGLDERTS